MINMRICTMLMKDIVVLQCNKGMPISICIGPIVYVDIMCGSRGGGGGGRGSGLPLENHKNIGFLSNTGPDPLKITKLPSQQSMKGHHRNASETPFKWRFAGGSMMARLNWYFEPS